MCIYVYLYTHIEDMDIHIVTDPQQAQTRRQKGGKAFSWIGQMGGQMDGRKDRERREGREDGVLLPIEKDLVWLLRDGEWEEADKLLNEGVSPHVLDREVCMRVYMYFLFVVGERWKVGGGRQVIE